MEAIGLEDVSKDDVRNMDEFDLANVMFYTHPTLALKLLACSDAAKRRRVVDASAKSFKRAIELGFTPRKSRLLSFFVNFTFVDAWVSFMADPHVTRFSISASCANSSSATTTRVLLAPKHITRDAIITRTMGFVLRIHVPGEDRFLHVLLLEGGQGGEDVVGTADARAGPVFRRHGRSL